MSIEQVDNNISDYNLEYAKSLVAEKKLTDLSVLVNDWIWSNIISDMDQTNPSLLTINNFVDKNWIPRPIEVIMSKYALS